MEFLSKRTVLIIGILFHVTFIMSILDIYFVSPLVHGMRHFGTPEPAPAKRLFLIVGDGLRADKCFLNITHPTTGESDYLAPYIRGKVLNEGTFGVSHTRMPTESRPGHVAIIAGFYEDVSAVTKGWKENPVDFDSVFNQSRHTYSYGSPDILPMFAQGASDEDRVDAIMYGHDFEDFTKSSIELDAFVFDHVDDLFDRAESDSELNAYLKQDKLVFFLHLLGIDTAGHGYRPYSAEYYDNIKYIDQKIQALEKRVEKFYKDDRTSWVFTADHGMSDFGSHGDGAPDNTRTPLVAWGAGISKPIHENKGHDEFSEPWMFGDVNRNDVNQADIASLMSYLVGLNYPANSVGELPLAFVDAPDHVKSKALQMNSYSIIEQYLVKEDQQKSRQIKFVPFRPLEDLEDRKQKIEALIASGDHSLAIEHSEELMNLGLQGLRYLQTYNWLFMRSLVTVGYVGWIFYTITSFLHLFVLQNLKDSTQVTTKNAGAIRIVSITTLVLLCLLFTYQRTPVNYFAYAIFPVFFWDQVLRHRSALRIGFQKLMANSQQFQSPFTAGAWMILLIAFILESIVLGYFNREIFSLCFGVGAFWPFIENGKKAAEHLKLSLSWVFLCLVLALFTLLPAIKVEDLNQIVLGGALMTLTSLYFIMFGSFTKDLSRSSRALLGVQLGLIPLSVVVTRSSVLALQAKEGLPVGNQIVGWVVLVSSQIVPFLHYRSGVSDYRFRLLSIFMAFCPVYVILTISFEGLFYLSYCAILLVWVELEFIFREDNRHEPGIVTLADIRISLFFFFLSQIGFFGTGNIASISSFSLDSVYRLIPIFDPFSMGILLMYKILVPFAIISVTLGIMNMRLGLANSALFSMVLCISDILTLNFFYLVVDEGSWLDIGTGISHFSISSLLCLFMIVLEYLSSVLTIGITLPDAVVIHDAKQKKD